jgi:uncharacterized protein YcbK (DUF882 family)
MRAGLPACPCCQGDEDFVASRRNLLRGALGLAAGGLACTAAGGAVAGVLGSGPRRLVIQRVQTGESFAGAYWRDGRYDREALRQLDWVFRDPTREEATPMDPRLFDVLATVARRMESTEGFEVVSGYRAPETNAANARRSRRVSTASLHMSGMAADARLPGRNSFAMARLAAELQIGGVGLYQSSGFVHLDCGPVRRW